MPNLTWPDGRPKCGECGNEDVTKFKPVRRHPQTGEPLAGINLLCLDCDTLYDMSDPKNANPR